MSDEPAPSKSGEPSTCEWVDLNHALRHFATYTGKTQSQRHIKPLHWYVASRLVLEGGFRPDEIMPRPPFVMKPARGGWALTYEPSVGGSGERTILGGLKTKDVDVVVTKEGIGPVLAVSCKGAVGAFRNLTNRMEEAVGDCTNLHITYPAMVCGYLFVMRANREIEEAVSITPEENAPPARRLALNDIAIQKGGAPVEGIIRFHSALRELTGRRGIRNDVSRYETVALALVECELPNPGQILSEFPPVDSPLRIESFFQSLYSRYDERYVYSAPDLKAVTQRLEWLEASPVFNQETGGTGFPPLDFRPRFADAS